MAAALLALGLGLGIGVSPARAADMETLEIVTKSGVKVFSVEMARSPEERERGLMFRKELPEGQGMLFDFSPPQVISMWMRNTYVPLDMIFIRADGRILRIAENTEPMSEKIISSGGPAKAVLEVLAGTARKEGIAPGDRVAGVLFGRN
ncbi:ACR OS=Afipia felis OX=1035 GN=BN961_01558 PE=4 SV=1 [Afipia felis]